MITLDTLSGLRKNGFIRELFSFAGNIPQPALACLIVLAVLFPVLHNGFISYDDVQYVVSNPALRGSWLDALAFSPGYYHPVVTLLYKAEFSLFGLDPGPYHIISLALHLANCASVYYLFSLFGCRREAAFLGTLLFGVHPLQVESVAWISGRKELLWGFFSFWTLICYLKYTDTGKNRFFILSLFCFLLAGFSKPFALMLVFALPLADYSRKRGFSAMLLLEKVPFFLSAISLFLLSWVPSGFLLAAGPGGADPLRTGAIALINLFFYLGKLMLPVDLSPVYPPPSLPAAPAGWFFLFIASATAFYAARRVLFRPEKPGPAKTAFFCLVFFLITIFPALWIFPSADRYAYVPAAGIFFLYSSLVCRLYEALSRGRDAACGKDVNHNRLIKFFSSGRMLAVLVAAHCAVLGGVSFARAAVWKDTFSWCKDVMEKYPREPVAYYARAGAYKAAGRYQEAIKDFDRCLELRPDDWKTLNNRAQVFMDMNKFDMAIKDYNAAILNNPGSAQLFLHRGNAYFIKGAYAAALKDYDRSLAIAPAYLAASENKRIVLGKLKAK